MLDMYDTRNVEKNYFLLEGKTFLGFIMHHFHFGMCERLQKLSVTR